MLLCLHTHDTHQGCNRHLYFIGPSGSSLGCKLRLIQLSKRRHSPENKTQSNGESQQNSIDRCYAAMWKTTNHMIVPSVKNPKHPGWFISITNKCILSTKPEPQIKQHESNMVDQHSVSLASRHMKM